jgi:hypothetical protein
MKQFHSGIPSSLHKRKGNKRKRTKEGEKKQGVVVKRVSKAIIPIHSILFLLFNLL